MDARVNEWNFQARQRRFQDCTETLGCGTDNCLAVEQSAVGSEFRAFGGVRGGIHVLVYDAVDAEAIVILRAGQLKTASDPRDAFRALLDRNCAAQLAKPNFKLSRPVLRDSRPRLDAFRNLE